MEFSIYKKSSIEEIEQLFIKVFSDSEGPSEGSLIGNLVSDLLSSTDAQDIYGFITTEYNQIVGSIFFTRLIFESGINAFILSPVAIHTSRQGKGIGQSLIKFGINYLKEKGVTLVFTYGDPDFYSKVGFKTITEKVAKAPFELSQPEGWLCQSLVGKVIEPISGDPRCVQALNKSVYW